MGIAKLGISGAHPRLRGEHDRESYSFLACSGSSPLTRGAPFNVTGDTERQGLIPAYAGSTEAQRRSTSAWWAHPRLRGEHFHIIAHSVGRDGSSPLTRGARTQARKDMNSSRLIPAYAGSTHNLAARKEVNRAHPRLRGEHLRFAHAGELGEGSSPLTRGARR